MSFLLILYYAYLLFPYAESTDDFQLGVLYIGSNSALKAVVQAEEDINNSNLLPAGYYIQVIKEESTTCNGKQSLDALYTHLFSETFHAVISGVCPHDANVLAAVTQYYQLTLISFVASSSGFDEEQLYPYHFHIVPNLSSVALGIANFISYHEFEWRKVVIITQDEDYFKMTTRILFATLIDRNYTVKSDILLSEGLVSITKEDIFVPHFRVYVLNVNSSLAKVIFCEAIHAGLKEYTGSYVWIIPGTYSDDWLSENITQTSFVYECQHSTTEIEEFVYQQRVIAINHYSHTRQNMDTLTNKSTHSLEEQFGGDDVAILAYDSVLTIAKSVADLTYTLNLSSDRHIGEAIKDGVQDVTFFGASGEIKFIGGSRQANFSRIFQYKNRPNNIKSHCVVGVIDLNSDDYTTSLILNQSLWPEGVPSDGDPITVMNYPLLPIVVVSYTYSGVVIFCAVLCLASTFALREKKLIRLTSPNLNYIIGLGVIIFCCSVFLFVYPPLPSHILVYYCGSRSWFAAIGFSLCFGTINTKMWRVYYIFHDIKPTSNKKAIKDWHLFTVVNVFIVVDVVILVIATSLPSTRLKPEITPDKEFGNTTNDDGITVKHEVIICEAKYKTLWLVILFGYKVVIQVIGVFLAFKIRKVKIKILNDSKEVALTLYITSIILAAVIIITVAFDDYLNVYSATYSLGIPLSSSIVLGVVFLSKMFKLYKDPKGETVFTHVTNDATGAAGGSAVATYDDRERIIHLEKRVKELQAKLTVKEGNEVPNKVVDSVILSGKQLPSQQSTQKKHVRIEGPD